jgi:hypothetical protein
MAARQVLFKELYGREFIQEFTVLVQVALEIAMETVSPQKTSSKGTGLSESRLKKSIDVRYRSETGAFEIYMADYAKYVISGRKPNSTPPPVAVILEWMRRKGIVGGIDIAYAISRKIGRDGIVGRDFLKKFVQDIELADFDFATELLARNIERELRKNLFEGF